MGVGIQFREITEEKKRGIVNYIVAVERYLDEQGDCMP